MHNPVIYFMYGMLSDLPFYVIMFEFRVEGIYYYYYKLVVVVYHCKTKAFLPSFLINLSWATGSSPLGNYYILKKHVIQNKVLLTFKIQMVI